MKPLRCLFGLHQGNVQPAYMIKGDVDGLSAFVCDRCGAVIEHGE